MQVMAQSADPRADELVLSMAGDGNTGVRISVAQAAANMQSTDSLDVLRKLSEDSDATVRAEAKRCLGIQMGKR
jgi:HEAT repeat protein